MRYEEGPHAGRRSGDHQAPTQVTQPHLAPRGCVHRCDLAKATAISGQCAHRGVARCDAPRASLAVATAKILSDRAANQVSSALFEVSGTRSADAALNLQRYWRNARTHTLHDPVRWKFQHIGRSL
ncbi:MAG: acyl-CoA dehydrogenase family protein, partial [Mycobacteriaceae bacterium]